MKLNFLQASVPLTKSYARTTSGLTKTPYPFVWEFTSVEETCNTLPQLESLLKKHAALGNCLLKGELQRALVNESRAGSTDRNSSSEWLVLDLDGLPETMDTASKTGQVITMPMTVDLFMAELGLQDVSYVVQWSASYGIENQRIRAHIFMMLDKAYSAPLLKQWLMQKNHEVPLLSSSMTLAKSGNALCWPLDVSACQNDKLIYIAPPKLKGIKDPMGKTPRIQYVKRKQDKLSLSAQAINSTEKNKSLTHKRIDELRDALGLPKRKYSYKVVGGTEVLLKPDEASITEMKTDRGFVYFNFNGGDSWAYYHPENNPDYIHNFKGEPSYLTKELLPGYWQQLTSTPIRTTSGGITYLAFCDRNTSAYWRGTYDATSDTLAITVAKNETQLRHFAKQHGVPLGDFIPEWDLVFDPQDAVRVDPTNRVVNSFAPSAYMKGNTGKKIRTVPKTVFKVLSHVLGGEAEIIEHFVNWLAYIVQKRDRTRTAWVLHGTTGTGKGTLMNNILRPLLGMPHTFVCRAEDLNEKYNEQLQEKLLILVDEIETKALVNERGVMAKLKNFITEPTITMRAMRQSSVEIRNYANWIFSSNRPDPIIIDREDRRFNVSKYQSEKLLMTPQEFKLIEQELQSFYDYLEAYPLDEDKASTILQTQDRETLISIGESSIDTAANALLAGNMAFFLDQLPTTTLYQRNALMSNKVQDYKDTLMAVINRTDPLNGKCNISRDELYVIFEFTIGSMPASSHKFTSLLKHHRLHTDDMRVDGKKTRGIQTIWSDYASFKEYVQTYLAPPQQAKPTLATRAGKKVTA